MEQIGISEEEKSFLLGELLTVGSYLLIAFDVRHPMIQMVGVPPVIVWSNKEGVNLLGGLTRSIRGIMPCHSKTRSPSLQESERMYLQEYTFRNSSFCEGYIVYTKL